MKKDKIKIHRENTEKSGVLKSDLYKTTLESEYYSMTTLFATRVNNARNPMRAINKLESEMNLSYQQIQIEMNPLQHEINQEFELNKSLEIEDIIEKFCVTENQVIQYARYMAFVNFFHYSDNEKNKLQTPLKNNFFQEDVSEFENLKKETSLAKQAIAVYHILFELGIKDSDINRAEFARFIYLITGKDLPVKLFNSEVYKKTKEFFSVNKSENKSIKDLEYVLKQFESLSSSNSEGLNRIVIRIKNEINSHSN